MHILLQRSDSPTWQSLSHEWYGSCIAPPCEFQFLLEADALVFSARRAASALLHPKAREGQFQEQLWRYDCAECYLASADGNHYMEFNLAPNGAWWAAVFSAPRVVDADAPAVPEGVTARGHADENGWCAELRIPLSTLAQQGLCPGAEPCRVAAAAILNSPEQVFLTTALNQEGRPDFHQPHNWGVCLAARSGAV